MNTYTHNRFPDESIIESVACEVHAAWAAIRKSQGWRYGDRLDQKEKLHPSIVPYEQLSEQEKEVDRATVKTVFKAIAELGLELRHPE